MLFGKLGYHFDNPMIQTEAKGTHAISARFVSFENALIRII